MWWLLLMISGERDRVGQSLSPVVLSNAILDAQLDYDS